MYPIRDCCNYSSNTKTLDSFQMIINYWHKIGLNNNMTQRHIASASFSTIKCETCDYWMECFILLLSMTNHSIEAAVDRLTDPLDNWSQSVGSLEQIARPAITPHPLCPLKGHTSVVCNWRVPRYLHVVVYLWKGDGMKE